MTAGTPQSSASASGQAPSQQQTNEKADGQPSVGELLSVVTKDVSTLMRQEVELAKAEIKAEVAKVGKGAGMLGGAGFGGYMVLLFLSIALWWGLATQMDQSWAALITAGVWAVITAVLAVLGRSTLKSVNPKPERTVETLQEVPGALKGQ